MVESTTGEFSVAVFYADGSGSEYVRRFVSAEEAMSGFCIHCNTVGARIGFLSKVIITDGLDNTNMEWQPGVGIVFPPEHAGEQPPAVFKESKS